MSPKVLHEDEIPRRKLWKDLLRRVLEESRRSFTSSDLAEVMNLWFKRSNSAYQISPATINHYRSGHAGSQEGDDRIDLRVPQNELVANALIWALDDLGAWEDADAQAKHKQARKLAELLGHNLIDRPSPVVEGEFFKGEQAIIDVLKSISEDKEADSLVLQIHSSIGFHTAKDDEVADAVIECLKKGVKFIYVIGDHWEAHGTDANRNRLKRMLDQVLEIPELKKIRNRCQSNVYALVEPHSKIPVFQTLLTRLGIAVRLGKEDAKQTKLDKSMLYRGKIERCWIEVTTNLSDDNLRSSEWLVFKEPRQYSSYLLEWWASIKADECEIENLFA